MKGNYQIKFGFNHITCVNCGFMDDVSVGNLDSEEEALRLAEDVHDDNKPRCRKNRKLIIEIAHLRYEGEQNG